MTHTVERRRQLRCNEHRRIGLGTQKDDIITFQAAGKGILAGRLNTGKVSVQLCKRFVVRTVSQGLEIQLRQDIPSIRIIAPCSPIGRRQGIVTLVFPKNDSCQFPHRRGRHAHVAIAEVG